MQLYIHIWILVENVETFISYNPVQAGNP